MITIRVARNIGLAVAVLLTSSCERIRYSWEVRPVMSQPVPTLANVPVASNAPIYDASSGQIDLGSPEFR
jgi:hypothetical protein